MKNNFDGLRLIGALLVLVSHQAVLQGATEPTFLGITLGTCGVAMFFGISGFLVTGSWLGDPHILRFGARRLLRLWPALAVVVLILAAGATYLPHINAMERLTYPIRAEMFLGNLAFIYWDSGFFPNHYAQLDGSLWTIPYEVGCYCLLVAGLILLRRRAGWLAAAALLVGPLIVDPLASLGACFLAGASMQPLPRRASLLAIAGAVVISLRVEPSLAVMLCLAVIAVEVGRRSWSGMRDCGRFGDLSYGTYLWAWPVTQIGVLLFGSQPWLVVLTLAATLSIAWLSWHVIESPALKLKPRTPSSNAVVRRCVGNVERNLEVAQDAAP